MGDIHGWIITFFFHFYNRTCQLQISPVVFLSWNLCSSKVWICLSWHPKIITFVSDFNRIWYPVFHICFWHEMKKSHRKCPHTRDKIFHLWDYFGNFSKVQGTFSLTFTANPNEKPQTKKFFTPKVGTSKHVFCQHHMYNFNFKCDMKFAVSRSGLCSMFLFASIVMMYVKSNDQYTI